jgi:hypothetical protein
MSTTTDSHWTNEATIAYTEALDLEERSALEYAEVGSSSVGGE